MACYPSPPHRTVLLLRDKVSQACSGWQPAVRAAPACLRCERCLQGAMSGGPGCLPYHTPLLLLLGLVALSSGCDLQTQPRFRILCCTSGLHWGFPGLGQHSPQFGVVPSAPSPSAVLVKMQISHLHPRPTIRASGSEAQESELAVVLETF